jgi:protocatechuate 3,4-dioxygenase beta subunit
MISLACVGIADALEQTSDEPQSTGGQQKAKRTMQIRVAGPDGKPVQGAKIHRSVWTKDPFQANRDFVCDAQGGTKIDLPKSVNILRLWARAEGYVPLFAHWESSELQGDDSRIPGEFTFKLQKGTVIGGVVKNEDGQPIADAKVEVRLHVGAEEQQNRVCFNTWLAEGDEARITDTQGRWMLGNVPAGDDVEVTVRLSHPDYISDYLWGVMQEHANVSTALLRQKTGTIIMARGIRVSGSVTDPTGKPVPGAVVVWGDDPYRVPGSQEVRTDEQGVYRFPPLPPMPAILTVMAQGWAPELKKTTITIENSPVDFQLKPGKTLRLLFVDDSGKPVPEVGVGIAGWRGGKSLYNHKHPNVLDTRIPTKADKNGIYEWSWAPPDQVEYSFGKEGYRYVRNEPYTADGTEHEVKLR